LAKCDYRTFGSTSNAIPGARRDSLYDNTKVAILWFMSSWVQVSSQKGESSNRGLEPGRWARWGPWKTKINKQVYPLR
jgi:hypothetical protein